MSGRGRLIYVMGPSGCGKDSVMDYARRRCAGSGTVFAHRYITRPADAGGENYVSVSTEEFQARLEHGLFVLHWESHGLSYGVGVEINFWMQSGLDVVLNGSRGYLDEAARRYPDMVPVQITVDRDTLRERLMTRGRESAEEVERRLARADWFECAHESMVCIDNSGALERAGDELVRIIEGVLEPL